MMQILDREGQYNEKKTETNMNTSTHCWGYDFTLLVIFKENSVLKCQEQSVAICCHYKEIMNVRYYPMARFTLLSPTKY